jgi:hypothetical protein
VGEGGTAYGVDQSFTTLPPWLFNEEASLGATASAGGARGVPSDPFAQIAAQLQARGRWARIAALLARGSFPQPFSAPAAGTAVIVWYYAPVRARARGSSRSSVIVAAGTAILRARKRGVIEIRVSSAGRRLLGAARHLRVSATCVFTPRGGAPIRVSAVFQLAR